jgi:glyoxylase-like metal-dependent hydrolase (beta-lactamase superfamily II)
MRRRLRPLFAVLIGLLGACAGTPRPPEPGLVALTDGVWLLPGRFPAGRQPDANSLVLEGRDGLVVIDSGRHAAHSQALLDFAIHRGRPIVSLVNTHWHLDHLGGNARLRQAWPGLRAIASPAVARAIAERFPASQRELEAMLADPASDEALRAMLHIDLALYGHAAALAPDRTFDGAPRHQALAGRRLVIGHEAPAASDGDLWIYDSASRLLAAGDLVTLPVPFFDTACPTGWRDALAHIDALPFERLVPGHGPPLDRAQWRRWRAAFEALLECAYGQAPLRTCSTRWIDDLGPLLDPTEQARAHAMLAHYIGRQLRGPDRDRHCARR